MNHVIIFLASYLIYVMLAGAAVFWLTLSFDRKKLFALQAILSGMIGLGLAKVAGLLYYHPRPFVVQHITPLVPHIADNGFPSEHTTIAMIIAFVVLQFSRLWGTVFILLAIGVGVGRIESKVHWPVDILGGIMIAAIAVLATRLGVYLFMKAFRSRATKSKKQEQDDDELV